MFLVLFFKYSGDIISEFGNLSNMVDRGSEFNFFQNMWKILSIVISTSIKPTTNRFGQQAPVGELTSFKTSEAATGDVIALRSINFEKPSQFPFNKTRVMITRFGLKG